MSSFSSATCHELKTLPRLKNTTDTRTLSPNQCSPSQHVMKLKLFQKQRMQQMQQLSLSLQTNVLTLYLFKNLSNTCFFALKTPKTWINPSVQASLDVFLFKIHICRGCHRHLSLFSNPTSKVNILHCYEFVFGLVEMK
jgi:hypothetical protein